MKTEPAFRKVDPATEEMARAFQARSAPKAKRIRFKMPTRTTRKGRRQRERMAIVGMAKYAG
jgi:hypothetical protein